MVDEKALPDKLQNVGTQLAPEIVEALKIEGVAQININILLQQAAEKAESPDAVLQHAESLIELSRKYEEHRLSAFRDRTHALIEAKERDPDEVEKRSNNRIRRILKYVIAACAISGIGGALLSVVIGGGIVVTGLLAAVGVVSIAMAGPLASGESISPNDVVRMVHALGDVIGKTASPQNEQTSQSRRKRR